MEKIMLKTYMLDTFGQYNYPRLNWREIAGDDISNLQEMLNIVGFACKIDGAYGDAMAECVTRFQQFAGITVDGLAGSQTSNALNNYVDLKQKNKPAIVRKNYDYYKNAILANNAYVFDDNKINLLGIRQQYFIEHKQQKYDDLFIILGTYQGNLICEIYQASTDPGVQAAVVLKSPQQLSYLKHKHNGIYPALRPDPAQSSMELYLNGNLIKEYKRTNIHAGGTGELVKNWSEGCIVIAGGWHGYAYNRFLQLTYFNDAQNEFKFTILDTKDFSFAKQNKIDMENDFKWSDSSLKKLKDCDNRIQQVINKALAKGLIDITVTCGHRGEQAQNEAYAKKTSKLKYPDSKHNKQPALAIDIVPCIKGRERQWLDYCFMAGIVLSVAKDEGIKMRWGGNWDMDGNILFDQAFDDGAHFELMD